MGPQIDVVHLWRHLTGSPKPGTVQFICLGEGVDKGLTVSEFNRKTAMRVSWLECL